MLEESLRRRLESLNRGPLPKASRGIGSSPSTTKFAFTTSPASPLRPGAVKPIANLLRRGEPVCNSAGAHLRIELPLSELWPGAETLLARRKAHLEALQAAGEGVGQENGLQALVPAFPRQTVYVDLETCGLAGSALFLVGMLRQRPGGLAVELLLARDYAEERAVLASFWEAISSETLLVTFNGKSFDWPMLQDRTARHLLFRGSRAPQPSHVDMLHHARRRWRRQLPDCRLQTLERLICRRSRVGDIPGSQIPAAYRQFVTTGATREMDQILYHNAVDLVTLLDLSWRLVG